MSSADIVTTNPDPTQNVRELVVAAILRLDDLRSAESRRSDELAVAERRHMTEMLNIRGAFYEQLALAEAKRIDAIRSVDVAAVAVANERATAQATVLASQVATSAETLRALVAATAATTAQQFQTLTTQITDRLSLLEKSQNERSGSGSGMRDMYGWIFGGIMLVIGASSVIWNISNHVH